MFLFPKRFNAQSTQIHWLTPNSFHYWQVQGICQHLFPVDHYRLPYTTLSECHKHIAALTRHGGVVLSGRLVPVPSDNQKCYYHISRLVAVKFYTEAMLQSLLLALIQRAKALGAQGVMVHVKKQSVASYQRLGFTQMVTVYENIKQPPLYKMFLSLE